ncbi:50S ribosomal protein L18e [Candidatus Woesearchaeota archaeon]|nr:50S ribosomal protein L18e [Candidatus Woesearchaeota archaeon]
MVKRTGPTNYQLKKLIIELKKKAIEEKAQFWKSIAKSLEKPARQRVIVNLARINKFSKENETIVVPGKILGDGDLDKKLNIVAFSFSESAKDKILQSKGKMMSIEDLMKEKIKTSEVRIIG